MGPRPEDGAVVDTPGRVHGTDRLSVIDASIVPNGPSAFTHIPVVMIAERLGRVLLDGPGPELQQEARPHADRQTHPSVR